MKLKSLFFAVVFIMSMGTKVYGNISKTEAVFIYNFLRHIKWPEENIQKTFVIGVYGDSQTYDQLLAYTKGRKIGVKLIVVRKVNSAEEASKCQLIFVPHTNSSKISELKKHLGNKACLIVSEKEGMNSSGSTIEFVIKDSALKFRVNKERAKRQNLIISKALIDMAIV